MGVFSRSVCILGSAAVSTSFLSAHYNNELGGKKLFNFQQKELFNFQQKELFNFDQKKLFHPLNSITCLEDAPSLSDSSKNDTHNDDTTQHIYIGNEGINNHTTADRKIVFASVFFRHGTRTPIVNEKYFENVEYPSSLIGPPLEHTKVPYILIDKETQKVGRPFAHYDSQHEKVVLKGGAVQGKITTKGQIDAYNLGQTLKSRYIDEFNLVDSEYSNKQVGCYSTNFSRTLDSLRCVLAGTFGNSINESNMATVYTRKNEDDYHFPNAKFCPPFAKWYFWVQSAQWSTGSCQLIKQKVLDIVKDESLLPSPLKLWDSLISQKSNELPIPSEFEEILSQIEECAVSVEKWGVFGDNFKIPYFSIGKVVDDLIKLCDKTVKYEQQDEEGRNSFWYHCHGKPLKLQLVACHDTTLFALISSIGGNLESEWPSLSSYVSFELFVDKENNPFVRVVFNGKPIINRFTDLEGFIEYSAFTQHYKRIRMKKNFKEACLEES